MHIIEGMVRNHLNNLICSESEEFIEIPMSWGGRENHTIFFEGWRLKFVADDPVFQEAVLLASKTARLLLDTYKNDYIVARPEFFLDPVNNRFGIRVSLMKKDRYEEMMEKYPQN